MIPAIVVPRTVILPLAYGWTVTVRDELTHGETTDMNVRMFRASEEGKYQHDLARIGDAVVIAYLVDWTLTDAQGQLIEVRGLKADDLQDAFRNLRQFAAAEVKRAIEAHHARSEAAIADLKKTASIDASSATPLSFAGSPA